MPLPLAVDHQGPAPIQRQLAEHLRGLILRGLLPPGSRLPSTRALSQQLSVSRGTVVIAYHRLAAEGYIETQSTSPTRVSRVLPEQFITTDPDSTSRKSADGLPDALSFHAAGPRLFDPAQDGLVYDFRLGRAESSFFPIKAWRRLIPECLGGAPHPLSRYGDPAGYWPLRKAIAEHLRSARGILCTPEQVIVTGGVQEGLNIVSRLLLKPDSAVIVENPCYQGAAGVFESYWARLVPIPVDGNGIDADRLHESDARLAYVTPSHQFPLGSTLSLARRHKLLDWAVARDGYVIEDDYDSDFRYRDSPLPALKALDRADRVIYLGTFSKSIGAGLRLGYMVVPSRLAGATVAAIALAGNGHPWLEQAVVAEFMRSGAFEEHLRRIRKRYMARRDCLADRLHQHFGTAVAVHGGDAGMHVAVHLPKIPITAHALQIRLKRSSVGVYALAESPARLFDPFPGDDRVILLGYACLSEDKITEAVSRLAAAARTA